MSADRHVSIDRDTKQLDTVLSSNALTVQGDTHSWLEAISSRYAHQNSLLGIYFHPLASGFIRDMLEQILGVILHELLEEHSFMDK